MAFIHGSMKTQELQDWLRDRFGVDPAKCRKLVMTIEPGNVVTVEATMLPETDDLLAMPNVDIRAIEGSLG